MLNDCFACRPSTSRSLASELEFGAQDQSIMAHSYTSSDEKEKGVSDGSSVASATTSEDVAFEKKTMYAS